MQSKKCDEKDKKQCVVVKQQVPFTQAVAQALFQGAIGAVIGAGLSAFTDPIVNRVLVQRISIADAFKQTSAKQTVGYFKTTLATNLIKYPIFEVLNKVVDRLPLTSSQRGIAAGAIFTTATLPITNYRYCRSVNVNVSFDKLYQAYAPTLVRDIIYGLARSRMNSYLTVKCPDLQSTGSGRFQAMFASVMTGCLVSSPLNELRGYVLQPRDRKLSFAQFFQLTRYVRSASLGAAVMALSLGSSAIIANPLQAKFAAAVHNARNYITAYSDSMKNKQNQDQNKKQIVALKTAKR
eukprot:TRINITY_DN20202_c0_g1_i1.p1 TRINITY_DN20202_c0_g1~~TRINITY_DN20202_c0_g1_i1.p1  ORF type:complete len:294 (-),score=48.39 TRINITY_DN20202_c0_g1_i1:155-1036(-)